MIFISKWRPIFKMAAKFQYTFNINYDSKFVSGHDEQKQIIWWKINILVWLASINDTKMHNILLFPPYECTWGDGGYYGLVVVVPPRRRPETLYRLRDNVKKSLSDCFYILYLNLYIWVDSWEASWTQSDYLWVTQPPPPTNSQTFTFFAFGPIYETLVVICIPCYTLACSVMMSIW